MAKKVSSRANSFILAAAFFLLMLFAYTNNVKVKVTFGEDPVDPEFKDHVDNDDENEVGPKILIDPRHDYQWGDGSILSEKQMAVTENDEPKVVFI